MSEYIRLDTQTGKPVKDYLYSVWDKFTIFQKTQVSRLKSQEPRPTLKPRLEFGAWNLEFES